MNDNEYVSESGKMGPNSPFVVLSYRPFYVQYDQPIDFEFLTVSNSLISPL